MSIASILFATSASAQILAPAGSPHPPAACVSFASPLNPDTVDGWTLRAVVEPVSRPALVRIVTQRGSQARETRTFLSFEVRGTGGDLQAGRVYRLLAAVDEGTRPSDAKRFLLLGWKADGGDRLLVEPQSRLDRLTGAPGTTATVGERTIFATCLLPTQAHAPASADDPLAATYRSLVDALRGAPDSAVRQATLALAQIPPTDSPVAPSIEGRPAVPWIRGDLSSRLAALPATSPVERFRYDGLLAEWDRPHRALAFLKALPDLLKAIGLDPRPGGLSARRLGDARDDRAFLARLNLLEGVDPDGVFAAVWNTPLRAYAIDPRLTRAPSVENQSRVLTYFDDPDPQVRAEAYSRLADWNSDWDRLRVSGARWSDKAGGVTIENEAALRDYWERKLGGAAKP